jgi:hypothetical protein
MSYQKKEMENQGAKRKSQMRAGKAVDRKLPSNRKMGILSFGPL